MRRYKKMTALLLAGGLAVSGLCIGAPDLLYPPGSADNLSIVSAAGTTYNTQNGTAVMGTGTASITINGNSGQTLTGKKFHIYKLFYAENASGGESINYTFSKECEQALKNVVAAALSKSGKQVSPADVTEYMVIDYIQTLNTNSSEGVSADQKPEGAYSLFRYFVENVREELVKQNVSPDVVNVKNVRTDQSVRLTGLDYGYYIIDEVTAVEGTHAASSLCMVDTSAPTASIEIKSDYPTVEKKIREDDPSDQIPDKAGWNDVADYEIGQTVPYKYTSDIPNMNGYDTYYYAWHDVMDPALTFRDKSVEISITGKDANGAQKRYILNTSEYTVNTNPGNGDTFQVSVSDIKSIVDREFDQMNDQGENVYGQTVVLTYTATLNERAAEYTGRPGFENDVRLEFSNDADSDHSGSTGYTPWDTVVCFTYKINTVKTNNHDKVLEGAKFRLYSDKDCKQEVYVKAGNGGYIVINRDSCGGSDHTGGTTPDHAVEMVSANDGTFTIFGLDAGTYYMKETDAPDGYRALTSPIIITVTPAYTNDRDRYVKGDGATETTLIKLDASAHIETFFDGLNHESDHSLETDVEEGVMNMSVVNQVGMKLPVTGTSAAAVMAAAGAVMMTAAIVAGKRKNKQKKA
jgi:fimbrial isopeptide formation D2 family protein/LPXTG-motif cell wall-anchored protein